MSTYYATGAQMLAQIDSRRLVCGADILTGLRKSKVMPFLKAIPTKLLFGIVYVLLNLVQRLIIVADSVKKFIVAITGNSNLYSHFTALMYAIEINICIFLMLNIYFERGLLFGYQCM